jgi:ornithine cyclodeaminase/alanine dehydrogenase-like protein (mu-crystallin family)
MFVLSEDDVAAVLPMRDVIVAVETALRAQAAGRVHQPTRVAVRTPSGMFGSMPCAIEGIFPSNSKHALHTHHAVIALFDPETGVPQALIDGRLITELRTAATSALATKALALEGAGVVAILGSGVQSRSHVAALSEIGMIRELRVWGRTATRAHAVVAWAAERGIEAFVSPTVGEAVRGAQIICTLTPAQAPILESYDVEPGTHVNAVGSSAPHMQELATALVGRSRLFVDTIEGAMTEAGDILDAIREGALPPTPAMVRLCDVIAGTDPGRTTRDDVTIFKSLGMAIEDIACATLAYERAKARGLGSSVLL